MALWPLWHSGSVKVRGAWWLVVVLACGDEPAAAEAPSPAVETPRPESSEAGSAGRAPTVTVDRSGSSPVVTAFGVRLNEPGPPPNAWHWNEGEVMLGGGPRMPMVRVPTATFTMGSAYDQWGRDEDERLHEVTISEHWMGATEVTRAQWRAVMGSDPPYCEVGCGDEHPVTSVSWSDAVRFTNELSRRLGLRECLREDFGSWVLDPRCDGFRLPTEAEWEHAARAGTSTPFWFGDADDLCHYANGSTEPQSDCADTYDQLAPVRSFPANPWGFYDLHGNVREWVWDWYGPYSSEITLDPQGPDFGSSRCLRGGAYDNADRFLRSSFRDSISPTSPTSDIGFRVVRSVPSFMR